MPIENEAQAISALAEAAAADAGEITPAPVIPAPSQPDQPSIGTTDAPAQVEPPQSDQPRIDLSGLDFADEAQVRNYIEQREREMQGDYTRKTQEAAELRKEAEEAMEFIQTLNTDPSFAYQVQQTLTQALQEQGYSFRDAQAIASQSEFDETDFLDPYAQKIQELENWKNAQDQRFAVQEATHRIESGIAAVRQANPNYTDADVQDILTMAFAYNGDVSKAAEAYQAVTQRVTESYLAQKESVPASLNQPSGTGYAEIPPEGFKDLNDPKLEEAAKAMLLNSGAQW